MVVTTVFYVNLQRPWRPIRTVEVQVVQCEKLTWAEDCFGKRRLLGASAFFTLASAERAKLGALTKLVKERGGYIRVHLPYVYQAALRELEQHSGVLHNRRFT